MAFLRSTAGMVTAPSSGESRAGRGPKSVPPRAAACSSRGRSVARLARRSLPRCSRRPASPGPNDRSATDSIVSSTAWPATAWSPKRSFDRQCREDECDRRDRCGRIGDLGAARTRLSETATDRAQAATDRLSRQLMSRHIRGPTSRVTDTTRVRWRSALLSDRSE